jgi:hypothetical protein
VEWACLSVIAPTIHRRWLYLARAHDRLIHSFIHSGASPNDDGDDDDDHDDDDHGRSG